jgi:hypothetical protein
MGEQTPSAGLMKRGAIPIDYFRRKYKALPSAGRIAIVFLRITAAYHKCTISPLRGKTG